MKLQVRINDFSSEGLSDRDYRFLRKLEIILLDSNMLKNMVYTEGFESLKRLMISRRELRSQIVCGVCDFTKLECFNVERWKFKDTRMRHFLKRAAESKEGLYIELRTPIKNVSADKRKKLIDLFPKEYRHVLIKKYSSLSGTDICLLLVALYLTTYGILVSIATQDETLLEASKEFGVKSTSILNFL